MRADLADEPAEAAAIDGLLRNGRARLTLPALAPRWASFTAPGGPEVRRFEGHAGRVYAVAFCPDGRHIVSGSCDRTLRLWEVEGGASRALEGHAPGGVKAAAFSPIRRLHARCRPVQAAEDGCIATAP